MLSSQYVKRMKTVELPKRPSISFEVAIAQAESRKAQLVFIPQEHKRPAASPASSVDLIAESATAAARSLQEIHSLRYDAYYRWGLSE